MSQLAAFFPHHPDYNLSTEKSFSETYRLIHSITCPIEGHPPSKIVLNWAKQRTCAICGEGDASTSFTKEAHTLASSLGNRHHTTLEECDICNEQFGKVYEEHLALLLNPERTLNRIRRRKGKKPPVLQSPNGSIEVDNNTGSITIKLEKSELERVKTTTNKQFTIKYIRPSSNRASAIRSLLKTAWLCMNLEERSRHPDILKLIKKEANLHLWQLWELNMPDISFSAIKFDIWEKKNDSDDISPLQIRLIIGDKAFLWVKPDLETCAQLPSPFPLIHIRKQPDKKNIASLQLSDIQDIITPKKEETITFSYQEITKGSVFHSSQAPRHPRSKFKVDIIHNCQTPISLKTICYIQQQRENYLRITLRGNELTALLIMQEDEKNKINASLIVQFEGACAKNVEKTEAFLKSIQSQKGDIFIRSSEANDINFTLRNLTKNSKFHLPDTEVLQQIITINSTFNVNIPYREEISPEARLTLFKLSSAAKNEGVFSQCLNGGTIAFTINNIGANRLLKNLEKKSSVELIHKDIVMYEFWGTQLPPLERTMIIRKTRLKESIQSVRASLNKFTTNDNIRLELIADEVQYLIIPPPT